MAQQQQEHPIFDDIKRGDLEAVQQRVLADGDVLEERQEQLYRRTPLMAAIDRGEPAIALWLLEHRGQHDLDAADDDGWTGLHVASRRGELEVVEALVAAGANPARLETRGSTQLIKASPYGHADIVAFLLRQPTAKASIDHINQYPDTALSLASFHGHQPIVQLLLDAGADPTIPAGHKSPLNQALRRNNHAIAALRRHTIAEAKRARKCVVLVEGKGGLYEDVYVKLQGFLLHAWAYKSPEA